MMVASTEVLDALKSIGLNLYERKIFVALLAKGVATAAEVSEIAGVPRSRSYDVLESLADKGFVVQQPSKPIKYVALEPQDALDRTKENFERKHSTMIERITKLQASPILNELEKIHKQSLSMVKPSDLTGTLKGRFMIEKQLNSIFKSAKSNINILTTEAGLEHLYNSHFKSLKKAGKRGVAIRIAAPGKNQKIVKEFSQFSTVRNVDSGIGRVYTIDGEHALFSLTDDKTHETQEVAFWASSPHLVNTVAQPLFTQIWGAKK